MTEILILMGETPSKKNSRINLRNGRSIPSRRYQEWHKAALEQIKKQSYLTKIDYPVSITLYFCHGDLRRRDSDNGTSSIMDLLVDAGILADDNWQIVKQLRIENLYEKQNPFCSIRIEPYGKKTS